MSAKAKMREPKRCLDHRVFNFKRGCFCYESNGVEQTRTGTSKVENSTQVLSCQLRFVHTRLYIYIKTRKLSAAPPMTPIFAKRNFLHQNEGNQSNNNPVLRSFYTCVFALHFRTLYAYPKMLWSSKSESNAISGFKARSPDCEKHCKTHLKISCVNKPLSDHNREYQQKGMAPVQLNPSLRLLSRH